MVVWHALLALATGFAVVVAAMALLSALMARLVPAWAQPAVCLTPGAVFVNLGGTFLSAAAGGCVVAWMAMPSPFPHVLTLAMAMLALTALTTLQSRGQHPAWFLLATVVTAPLGVVAGGLLWLRATGILG